MRQIKNLNVNLIPTQISILVVLCWFVWDRLCNTTLSHVLTRVQPRLAKAQDTHDNRPSLSTAGGSRLIFLDLRQTERQMERVYVRAKASPSVAFINGADVCRR